MTMFLFNIPTVNLYVSKGWSELWQVGMPMIIL